MTDSKHTEAAKRNKGGRPRKGTLEYKHGVWKARLTVTVEGESLRRWFSLETQNKAVARRKMARLLAQQEGPSLEELEQTAKREETYAELSKRVSELRKADGVRDYASEDRKDARYILPAIGSLPLSKVGADEITGLLCDLRDTGKSQSTIRHAVHVLRTRLGQAERDRLISQNPLNLVKVPKGKVDRRERAVLTDAELASYLAWQHPEAEHQVAVLQRQTMACMSRMFGGLRTGDLHTLKWEALDTTGGRFAYGWAPRKKTSRPQRLNIPDMLRPILHDWWQRQGRPSKGLLFPVLRGDKAGKGEKGGVSHAHAFRRDLKRAFGIEVLESVTMTTRRDRGLTRNKWVAVRELTERELELFTETEHTRPVDFHSWRRSYVQALADAEVNAQQAAALSGHSSGSCRSVVGHFNKKGQIQIP